MLVAIDLGNTMLTYGLFDGPALVRRGSILVEALGAPDALDTMSPDRPDAVALASVNPGPAATLAAEVARRWGLRPRIVGEDLPVPIEIRYDNPREVGADRLMNAVAARARYGREAIVVDFGTAVTFDLIDREGAYLGGLILPGIDTAARALASRTALLSYVPMERPERIYGSSTREAIRCGLFWGTAGAIRAILGRLVPLLGAPRIASTGGDAAIFRDVIPEIEEILPDITLDGIRLTFDAAGRP
ncbi:MAG: type III pantothenate kinase [Planctomycetes bacterium]|nr:type III pantothenate kinase [Planctomycetota bacterium]